MQSDEKLLEVKMEELDSLWTYEEAIKELKQNLLYTTIELESLKKEASEKIQKQKEDMKCLINLLRVAYQQRDEAKEHLQILLINKLKPSSPTEHNPILPHTQQENPLLLPPKTNSTMTESSSLSETYNSHYSHGSPPVDSLFNPVSSPDFSTINVVDSRNFGTFVNQPFVQDSNGSNPSGLVPSGVPKIDRATAVIDGLVKGKSLPQKGKLMETVMEAGPLLQTLLLAGPLPRWRNPPPMQPFKIPPVTIRISEAVSKNSNVAAAAAQSSVLQKPISIPSTFNLSSQMFSASVPCNVSSRSSGQNNLLVSSGACINNLEPNTKRQRFH
ncbi:hypothetical protein HS088_TW07G00216 [Tripterygium wilfordii]|uniref:TOX high mobility group box family member 4-A n=2 Tax=Tripterygium wilfordii TaxID=458696 RepID=A0A7J7DE57_TRIWF|nr:hypothetical protein HS088_TW07G00216 [Tripterygium wilfordii]